MGGREGEVGGDDGEIRVGAGGEKRAKITLGTIKVSFPFRKASKGISKANPAF